MLGIGEFTTQLRLPILVGLVDVHWRPTYTYPALLGVDPTLGFVSGCQAQIAARLVAAPSATSDLGPGNPGAFGVAGAEVQVSAEGTKSRDFAVLGSWLLVFWCLGSVHFYWESAKKQSVSLILWMVAKSASRTTK